MQSPWLFVVGCWQSVVDSWLLTVVVDRCELWSVGRMSNRRSFWKNLISFYLLCVSVISAVFYSPTDANGATGFDDDELKRCFFKAMPLKWIDSFHAAGKDEDELSFDDIYKHMNNIEKLEEKISKKSGTGSRPWRRIKIPKLWNLCLVILIQNCARGMIRLKSRIDWVAALIAHYIMSSVTISRQTSKSCWISMVSLRILHFSRVLSSFASHTIL